MTHGYCVVFSWISDDDNSQVSLCCKVSFDPWKYVALQDATADSAKAYLEVAADTDDVPFYITSNDDVFAEYKAEGDKIVLFKKVFCLSYFLVAHQS